LAAGGGGEKTEKATPKKRRDAREKEGNVLQSKEITIAASIFFTFFALLLLGKYMFRMITETISIWFARIGGDITPNSEFIMETAVFIMRSCAMILVPLVAVTFTVPIIVVLFQTKGLFTMKPISPKFSKLNPINGFKRLFSLQSSVGIIKGLIELGAIGAIVYARIIGNVRDYQRLTDMDVIQGVSFIAKTGFDLVMTIIVIFAFVAVGDYIFQWWQYEKKLRMSKQEVKDEYKQIEGDPQIKGKIKQKQREVAMKRMMEQVPAADVVVRNPTHFAVALIYEKENTSAAPRVVAKGKDSLALKIIDIAEKHEVYITENRPLARELYETVEIGGEIPPSLYNAIAIILTDMYAAKGITING
jgi:flagellar biosynthetic protein FlhB